MLILLLRWLAFIVSMTLLLVYFKGGLSVIKDTRRSVKKTGKYFYIFLAVSMYLSGLTILLTQFFTCLGIINVFPWADRELFVTMGTVLLIMGISTAFWIRYRYLKRFWSGSVEIRTGHEVIEDRPYRIVRHPLYALTLIIYPGAALAFPVWWNWLLCCLMVTGYIWLTVYEDRFLEKNLPGYREYQQRTQYRLVPGVW